jgi:SAM-dependent methyltransferase
MKFAPTLEGKRLNCGCGKDYRDGNGWINLDLYAEQVDVRHDIKKTPWPFEDDSFVEIYASGVLEQIADNEQFRNALNECHRVLRPQGHLTIIVPNAQYPVAFRDPFDCRRFTEEPFRSLNQFDRYYEMYGSIYGFKPWAVLSVETNINGIIIAKLGKP